MDVVVVCKLVAELDVLLGVHVEIAVEVVGVGDIDVPGFAEDEGDGGEGFVGLVFFFLFVLVHFERVRKLDV